MRVGSGEPLVEFRSLSGDLSVVRPTARRRPHPTQVGRKRLPDPSATAADPPTERVQTSAPANGAIAAAYEDARLRILRSLERGEIDVDEAGLRLEALDRGPGGPDAPTDGATGA